MAEFWIGQDEYKDGYIQGGKKCDINEYWKWIPGYEEMYAISTFGRVKSFWNGRERILKLLVRASKKRLAKYGQNHLYVDLYKDGKAKHHSIHQLVATTHLPNPNHLPEVDHIDNDPTNNHVSNLRWCTRRGNGWNRSDHRSGQPCITWNKRDKKWQVYVRIEGKKQYVGYFDKMEDATVGRDNFFRANGIDPTTLSAPTV